MSHSHDSAMDPPSFVQLTGIQSGQAQFIWTPIDSCTTIHYAISTNCSTQCSLMTTNQTTTSCTVSDLEPAIDVVVCDFNVQSVVCGNLMGDFHTALYDHTSRYVVQLMVQCIHKANLGTFLVMNPIIFTACVHAQPVNKI